MTCVTWVASQVTKQLKTQDLRKPAQILKYLKNGWRQPSAGRPFKKFNFGNSGQKLCKCNYQNIPFTSDFA